MKITKLELTNIFSFGKKEVFEFNDLNLIIGPNNHGKSNVLRSIIVVRDILSAYTGNEEKLKEEKIPIRLTNFNDKDRINISHEIQFISHVVENDRGQKITNQNLKSTADSIITCTFNLSGIHNAQSKDFPIQALPYFNHFKKHKSITVSFLINDNNNFTAQIVKAFLGNDEKESKKIFDIKNPYTLIKVVEENKPTQNFKQQRLKPSFGTHVNAALIEIFNQILSQIKPKDRIFFIDDQRKLEDFIPAQNSSPNTAHLLYKLQNGNSETIIKSEKILSILKNLCFPQRKLEELSIVFPYDEKSGDGRHFIKLNDQENSNTLSSLGVGVKQIIALAINIYSSPKNSILLIEEPELNLNARLERALIKELEIISEDYQLIITSQSNTFLNEFLQIEKSKVYLIEKNEEGFSERIDEKSEEQTAGLKSLKSLGAQPSDVLQTNGVIWVEGPSDIIYIQRWIELFIENNCDELKLTKGYHYSFLMYAGSILKDHSFHHPEITKEISGSLVNSIKINQNAFLVLDKDNYVIEQENDYLDDQEGIEDNRKKAKEKNKKEVIVSLKNHLEALGTKTGYTEHLWMTKSKEVEDYIPENILKPNLKKTIKDSGGKITNNKLIDTDNIYNVNGQRIENIYVFSKKMPLTKKLTFGQDALLYNDWFLNQRTGTDLTLQIKKLLRRICEWNDTDWSKIEGLKEE